MDLPPLRQYQGSPIPEPDDGPLLGFRFAVFFFAAGVEPNSLDIRFQRVRGLSATVETAPQQEGGQNLYTQKLPRGIDYGNLVLERGRVVGSPLDAELQAAFSLFRFVPSNVVVILFGDQGVPKAAWLFLRAYPVKWSTSDLDADDKKVVIDTLELAYSRMQPLPI